MFYFGPTFINLISKNTECIYHPEKQKETNFTQDEIFQVESTKKKKKKKMRRKKLKPKKEKISIKKKI